MGTGAEACAPAPTTVLVDGWSADKTRLWSQLWVADWYGPYDAAHAGWQTYAGRNSLAAPPAP